jgi:hypothetical protein
VARFARRTKVVSKSVTMVDLTMRLWAYFEQPQNFAAYQEALVYLKLTLPKILASLVPMSGAPHHRNQGRQGAMDKKRGQTP